MSCIHLTVIFLSLSACARQAPERAWMQRAELRADARLIRFVADERGLRPPKKIEAALEAMVLDTVRGAVHVAALAVVAEVRFLTRAVRDHRRVARFTASRRSSSTTRQRTAARRSEKSR
jgi:hypothetical protein